MAKTPVPADPAPAPESCEPIRQNPADYGRVRVPYQGETPAASAPGSAPNPAQES